MRINRTQQNLVTSYTFLGYSMFSTTKSTTTLAARCTLMWLVLWQLQVELTAAATRDYYIGAVVEFPAPSASSAYTAASALQQRIQRMRQLIEMAPARPDIIVFPERVLNQPNQPIIVPTPAAATTTTATAATTTATAASAAERAPLTSPAAIVPCGAIDPVYDYIITEISCYARSLQVYLLINVVEVENCTNACATTTPTTSDCSSQPCAIYNTNVVFDRAGAVISRYRKYNLIGAEWLYYNYTAQPEQEATFHTDFNVTFGHFTRMDVLYQRPAQALIERGITDFLHPSKWQSELPFMTAVQLHQAWAYSNDVNLLVAGTNDPRNGHTGSGIYSGKQGALLATMTSDEELSNLHLSVIPKLLSTNRHQLVGASTDTKPQRNKGNSSNEKTLVTPAALDRFTGVKLTRDSDIDLYTTHALSDADGLLVQKKLCHNELCCHFHIARHFNEANLIAPSNSSFYYYRLATFRGMGTFLNTEPDALAVCALFACVGDHVYSCGRIYPEEVDVVPMYTFDVIRIMANFTTTTPHLIMPTSVDGMLMPLPVDEFSWQVQQYSNITSVNYTLLQPRDNLLTFGIYVNYFLDETDYDHHQPENSSSVNYAPHGISVISIFIASFCQQIYLQYT